MLLPSSTELRPFEQRCLASARTVVAVVAAELMKGREDLCLVILDLKDTFYLRLRQHGAVVGLPVAICAGLMAVLVDVIRMAVDPSLPKRVDGVRSFHAIRQVGVAHGALGDLCRVTLHSLGIHVVIRLQGWELRVR